MTRPKPLWKADHQKDRLSELTAQSDDSAKDHALRRDVRSLGALLGRVLVEQAGQELFDIVEELRRLMIRHRERAGHSPAAAAHGELMARAQAMISEMDLTRAYQVTKAFAIYFELANLAETNHRKRRRRAGQLDRHRAPLPGSLHGTLLRMKGTGISADAALAALRQVIVTPVFTAHPTEVARQTVLLKRRRIAEQLERLDRLPLTVGEARRCEQLIHAEIASLWQTDEVRQTKPTVNDEIRMGLRYFRLSLFETLPRIYAEVAESLRDAYGMVLDAAELPNLLSFGSWIGGDRDGNPLVKPECVKDALELARTAILREYSRQVEFLSDCLSSSSRQVAASAEILSRLAQYERSMPGASMAWGPENTVEHYRRFLSYVFHRLQRSREGPNAQDSYKDAAEFESDLVTLRTSLISNRGQRLAETFVDPLLRQIRHPPTCPGARGRSSGDRRKTDRSGEDYAGGGRCFPGKWRDNFFPDARADRDLPRSSATQADLSGTVHPAVHHQRRRIRRRCTQRGPSGEGLRRESGWFWRRFLPERSLPR